MGFNENKFISPLFKLFGKPLAGVPPSPSNLDIIQFNSTTKKWELVSGVIGNAVQTSSNVGTGDGLALPRVGDDLPFKSLKAGSNVTLTPSATEILIQATGGAFDILADDTLGADSDTFDSIVFSAREFLLVLIHLESVGGALDTHMRFNDDSGIKYAYQRETNFSSNSTFVNQDHYEFDIGTPLNDFAIIWIDNPDGKNKLIRQMQQGDPSVSVGTAPQVGSIGGKFVESAQLTKVNLLNTGVGDYLGGACRMIVMGSKT